VAPVTAVNRYHLQDPDETPTADAATQQMREAAGRALAEANERLMEAERKLAAAEAARRELQEQAEAAKQLAEQVGAGRVLCAFVPSSSLALLPSPNHACVD
jgi:methylmalonyl-CoA mutase N-terminal domain/subunit